MAEGRGRKTMIVLVVLVVVLGGLLVVADRVAAYAAERTLARQAAQQLPAHNVQEAQTPKVTIGGFPFLTQVARGKYDKVTIDLTQPVVEGVQLDELDVVATGVNAPTSAIMKGQGTITADQVTGTARVGWSQVPKLLQQAGIASGSATVSANDAGQVVVREPLTIQGSQVSVVATGTVTVVDGAVRVKVANVQLDGAKVNPILQRLVTAAAGQLGGVIKLPPLPYNLKVQSVVTTPSGLTATAVAANVPLNS